MVGVAVEEVGEVEMVVGDLVGVAAGWVAVGSAPASVAMGLAAMVVGARLPQCSGRLRAPTNPRALGLDLATLGQTRAPDQAGCKRGSVTHQCRSPHPG